MRGGEHTLYSDSHIYQLEPPTAENMRFSGGGTSLSVAKGVFCRRFHAVGCAQGRATHREEQLCSSPDSIVKMVCQATAKSCTMRAGLRDPDFGGRRHDTVERGPARLGLALVRPRNALCVSVFDRVLGIRRRRSMPYRHRLQASRFELKFIINEYCAAGIRDFSRAYLEPDEFADPQNGNSYLISSLYLDNPELSLYRQTTVGEKNRFKLRIRFYDDNPDHPAFLEIKRRVTDVIRKERAKVSREGARRVLAGHGPDPSFLIDHEDNGNSGSALINFCDLCSNIGAKGCIYVSYRREAYVSPNSDLIRVTFDRHLRGSPYRQGDGLTLPSGGAYPAVGNDDNVILELKFTDRFATWMRELVQEFNLQRTSIPKYVHCIDEMGLKPGQWDVEGMLR